MGATSAGNDHTLAAAKMRLAYDSDSSASAQTALGATTASAIAGRHQHAADEGILRAQVRLSAAADQSVRDQPAQLAGGIATSDGNHSQEPTA